MLLSSPPHPSMETRGGNQKIHRNHSFPRGDEFLLPGCRTAFHGRGRHAGHKVSFGLCGSPFVLLVADLRALLFRLCLDSVSQHVALRRWVWSPSPWFWAWTSDPSWASSCSCLGFPEAETPSSPAADVDVNLKLAVAVVTAWRSEWGPWSGAYLAAGEEFRLLYVF